MFSSSIIGFIKILVFIFEMNVEIKHKRILTPADGDDLTKVLNESYLNVYKEMPNKNIVAGAWAHIALENNHGKKIWNYNLGNIGKLPNDPPVPYYSHFGKAKYRSFDGFVKGGEAYWSFLSRCPMAIKNFRLQNPQGAASSLKRCNYYRSNESEYSKTLSSLYAEGIRRTKRRY
jgi:hypothetical protein